MIAVLLHLSPSIISKRGRSAQVEKGTIFGYNDKDDNNLIASWSQVPGRRFCDAC